MGHRLRSRPRSHAVTVRIDRFEIIATASLMILPLRGMRISFKVSPADHAILADETKHAREYPVWAGADVAVEQNNFAGTCR
jgi:hypothetical protein